MKKNSSFINRVSYALSGIKAAFLKESSLRIQTITVIFLIFFCIFQKPEPLWCALFFAMCGLVISLELINTAIEALLDKMYPDFDKTVKYIKDCLAGAVLLASMSAVIVFIFFLSTK